MSGTWESLIIVNNCTEYEHYKTINFFCSSCSCSCWPSSPSCSLCHCPCCPLSHCCWCCPGHSCSPWCSSPPSSLHLSTNQRWVLIAMTNHSSELFTFTNQSWALFYFVTNQRSVMFALTNQRWVLFCIDQSEMSIHLSPLPGWWCLTWRTISHSPWTFCFSCLVLH